jgi:hypothetical protein
MKKIILYFFIILGIYTSVWIYRNLTNLQAFPFIISSYYSKEFCSCYFVVGNTKEFCHDYVRQYVPISEFNLNEDEKNVTVKGLGITTISSFKKGEGCTINP